MRINLGVIWLILLCGMPWASGQSFTQQPDVIYGRKFGMALTMDVFHPNAEGNHAGVMLICSGGWFSAHEVIDSPPYVSVIKFLIARHFTVFAVVHGSQPRFTITDAVADVHRAARFIRFHAWDYGIDPNRLGVTGGSSGGHLSLMEGVKTIPGDPKSSDPVARTESRVEAVACFFPPTDFLNYGGYGKLAWETNLKWLPGPFDFQKLSKDGRYVLLTDDDRMNAAIAVSPIYLVSSASAPTLIIHGDADQIVPIEQSQRFIAKLKAAGVPAELIVRHGKNHGWADMQPDWKLVADWFDRYLLRSPTTKPGELSK